MLSAAREIVSAAILLDGPLVPLLTPTAAPPRALCSIAGRASSFGRDWNVETFVAPAAFPRAFPGQTQLKRRAGSGGRTGEAEVLQLFQRQVESCREQIDIDDKRSWEKQESLSIAVNRYSRKSNQKSVRGVAGLTLVFAHANGFHKEIWEPTFAHLIEHASGADIEEIWSLDCVNQGQAALLNADVLGDAFNWSENGRDILNFIINYIDSPSLHAVNDSTGPRHLAPTKLDNPSLNLLDRHTPTTVRSPRHRQIVGIGHSLGGGGMAFASTAIPSLFAAIIFVDPVIVPVGSDRIEGAMRLAGGALARQDRWSTKAAAKESFLQKQFFRAWDPAVLDVYIEYGLSSKENRLVGLTMRKMDEALVFADPSMVAAQRSFVRLEGLPATLPVHFILADINRSVLDEDSIELVLGQVKHATAVRVAGTGHLIPQDKPKATADEIGSYLERIFSSSKAHL